MDLDFAAIGQALSVWALPVIIAITFHEAAHGWMAERCGDQTARMLGRVTFNPIKHVDPIGTFLLPGALLLLKFPFVFGYAKPVPVNFRALNHPKRDMIWVALAGPAINLILAYGAALAYHLGAYLPDSVALWVVTNLDNAILVNVLLAVFNMLPLPPLDGGRVLTGLLPYPYAYYFAQIERYGILILIGTLILIPYVGRSMGFDINPVAAILMPPIEAVHALILMAAGF
jgi:Zn-dependent protease